MYGLLVSLCRWLQPVAFTNLGMVDLLAKTTVPSYCKAGRVSCLHQRSGIRRLFSVTGGLVISIDLKIARVKRTPNAQKQEQSDQTDSIVDAIIEDDCLCSG